MDTFLFPVIQHCLTAIQFDRTGTTRIGKYVLNHSFMLPGIVTTVASVIAGLLLAVFFIINTKIKNTQNNISCINKYVKAKVAVNC